MPERNLFFFVVMLGVEITYLVITYFMGKKNLVCVCILNQKAKEPRCGKPVLFICRQWSMFTTVSPRMLHVHVDEAEAFCQSRTVLSSKPTAPSYCFWHGDPHYTAQLILDRDCSLCLSLALKSTYLTNCPKISGFLSECV